MGWLLFLARLSLICGLFFAASLAHLVWPWMPDETMVSTFVTIGYFMGMLIVPFTLLAYLLCWLFGKKPGRVVPRWLLLADGFALLLLIAYIMYANVYRTTPDL